MLVAQSRGSTRLPSAKGSAGSCRPRPHRLKTFSSESSTYPQITPNKNFHSFSQWNFTATRINKNQSYSRTILVLPHSRVHPLASTQVHSVSMKFFPFFTSFLLNCEKIFHDNEAKRLSDLRRSYRLTLS